MKLEFCDRYSKNNQILFVMKIRSLGAELFHAGGRTDGRTDVTKLIVAFRNFASAPKNVTAVNAACQGNISACYFGHACHRLANLHIGVNRIIILKWMLRKFYV
jgi:hypothetical protein